MLYVARPPTGALIMTHFYLAESKVLRTTYFYIALLAGKSESFVPRNDIVIPAFILIASCEYAIASTKLTG